ncbi:UNKNOWN [Stylonychia lemnae]|uniref:Uncharacterized protein n=1 Tax=Stylonychia lemnae TaxID=5949 RepID=A0A078AJR1_STYLE|nr:UNKNOWN [Stylonychia lemnae]|eukprot:CDW81048.1 UNKNOWN [Stylonychia lemnae]
MSIGTKSGTQFFILMVNNENIENGSVMAKFAIATSAFSLAQIFALDTSASYYSCLDIVVSEENQQNNTISILYSKSSEVILSKISVFGYKVFSNQSIGYVLTASFTSMSNKIHNSYEQISYLKGRFNRLYPNQYKLYGTTKNNWNCLYASQFTNRLYSLVINEHFGQKCISATESFEERNLTFILNFNLSQQTLEQFYEAGEYFQLQQVSSEFQNISDVIVDQNKTCIDLNSVNYQIDDLHFDISTTYPTFQFNQLLNIVKNTNWNQGHQKKKFITKQASQSYKIQMIILDQIH